MEQLPLTELIAPLPGERAAGGDVRLGGAGSELYLTVKDERANARLAEREALVSGDPEAEPLLAGARAWGAVAQGGAELLAHHTKDIQVAAWLVEAWLRTDGLAGLADGFTVLAELVEHYWDDGLYPRDEEDEADARLAPLHGLFGREEPGTLIQPIKLLPLTDVPGTAAALWNVEAVRAQSVRHDDPDMREELVQRRAQRVDELDAAIAAASPAFVADALGAIERALAELDRLMATLDARTGGGRFGSQVTAPLVAIADLLGQHRPPPPAAPGTAPTEDATDATDATVAARSPGETAPETPPKRKALDRDTALATLIEIAGYFDGTEPQSLIGQGLREIVRRARMPLDDLLAELLPDREQRAMFLLRAGIRAEPAGGGDGGFTTF